MKHDSIQRKLSRVKPPRVQITYDLEVGDASEKRQLPMVIGVISPLSGPQGRQDACETFHFRTVTRQSVDSLMASVQPRLSLTLPNHLSKAHAAPELELNLHFNALKDFDPDALVKKVPALSDLATLRAQLLRLRSRLAGNPSLQRKVRHALATPRDLVTQDGDRDAN